MANDWFLEPGPGDAGGFYEFFRYINNTTEGLFFPIILLALWMISFIVMLFSGNFERPGAAKAWVFASFFVMVLSILLAVVNLIANKYMYITMVFLGIGAVWLILEGKGS